MSVAWTIEISVSSGRGVEDAIQKGHLEMSRDHRKCGKRMGKRTESRGGGRTGI